MIPTAATPRPDPAIPPADGVDWRRAFLDLYAFTVTHLDTGWATDPPEPLDATPPPAWGYLTAQEDAVRRALTGPHAHAYAGTVRAAIREVDA